MKKFIFIAFLICGFLSNAQNKEKKIEIALQDFFRNDRVSVTIGRCVIIKNKKLTSSDTGFSGVIAEFYEPNEMIVSFYEEKKKIREKKCNIDFDKNLVLHLKINNELKFSKYLLLMLGRLQ